MKAVEDYVRSLGLDAYLVGGAVRDELLGQESKDADFLVAGVDMDALREALQPHGRRQNNDQGTGRHAHHELLARPPRVGQEREPAHHTKRGQTDTPSPPEFAPLHSLPVPAAQ